MPDPTETLPVRTDGLEINVMHDGVVVYQRENKQIHYLNHTAGLVLELCDGDSTAGAIAASVGEAYALPQAPLDDVVACIEDLLAKGLIR